MGSHRRLIGANFSQVSRRPRCVRRRRTRSQISLQRRAKLPKPCELPGTAWYWHHPRYTLRQPRADLRRRVVHLSLQHLGQFSQLVAKLLARRSAVDGEIAFAGLAADVRETQKVERLRRAIATLRSPLGRVSSELDQPRFLRVQFQAELGKPLPKVPPDSVARRIPRGTPSRNRPHSAR